MDELSSFSAAVKGILPLIGVAAVGCSIQCFKDWQGWRNFIASNLTACFGAFLVGMMSQDVGLSQGFAYGLCGMIGYSGGRLVDEAMGIAKRKIEKVAGVKEDEK